MTENYYHVLGVSQASSTEQILTEYKIRAKSCHPDKGGSQADFVTLVTAKKVLTDEKQRRLYDKWLLLDSAMLFSGKIN